MAVDRSDYLAATRLVHKGPCIVKDVHVNYNGASSGAALIYDGENDQGELKARVGATTGFDSSWRPGQGTDFDFGIYITVGTGINCTVTYETESRKEFI